MKNVSIQYSTMTIPTYPWEGDDKEAPLIREFTPRGQPIYPYTSQEKISSKKEDREYKSVILENEFLRLTFLPEMNGRLYSASDKVNKREMFYNNPQMKPSLFGLRGAWCANGVEYNFPNSHSTTTLEPIEFQVVKNKDGSASVICGDCERVSRMIWSVEAILRPGSASIEMQTKLNNPTEYPKRFYYWMNAAVPIYPETQFIYPESTKRLYTHPPMDISRIAYLDYPVHKGRDISRFKNIPQHFPVFAEEMKEDFFGIYHHHLDSGIVHVADHALVRGRKIWMFGNQRDGRIWIDLLTDSGIDYCEVQTGPFSLQSDYRLLEPGRMRIQKDTWMPIGKLGGFNAASEKLAANIKQNNGNIHIRLSAAQLLPDSLIIVSSSGKIIYEKIASLHPLELKELEVPCKNKDDYKVEFFDSSRNSLLAYEPCATEKTPELPLNKKLKDASLEGDYWEKQGWPERAYELRSKDNSQKSIIAKARMDMDSGLFEKALKDLEALRYIDDENAEALLYAAICLKNLGQYGKAEKYLSRSCYNADLMQKATMQLSEISIIQSKYPEAKKRLEQIRQNTDSSGCLSALYSLCVRKCGDNDLALEALGKAKKEMPFEPLLIGECFIQENHGTLKGLRAQMLIEILCRYINLNERDDALQILNAYLKEENNTMPLLLHYKAFLENKTPPENTDGKWDFISRIESANVLRYAIDKNPEDYSSLYHLGNFYAHKRRWEDALACWRKVKGNCKSLALRGEGVYWWKIKGDMEQASESYRQAAEHEDCGAKTLWEYDHLLDEKNDNETRVRLFEEHADLASSDKRLLLRKADALVSLGKAEEAMEILLKNSFPLCEGKILPRLLFEDACWQIAERHRENNDFDKALENMMKPMAYPENLGVGKPASNMEAEWFWRCGKLCQEKGNQEKANEFFKRGADPGNGIPIDFFPLKNLVWQHDSEMIELPVWINILFRADCLKELQMQDESEKTFSYARSFIEDKLKEERENEPELKVLKHLLDVLSGEKTESSWTPQKIPYTRFLQYET